MITRKPEFTRAAKVYSRLKSPIEKFLATEAAGGIILLINTIIAMVWANSMWSSSYEHFIHMPISFSAGGFEVSKSLNHWVNDFLMAIFFFMVGMEIKRELVLGELSSPRKAALPMFAALGGMVIPAAIYAIFNFDGAGADGWGIPMATDIAFAVGILSLMSRKVPFALKVFLLALAIVDDLGAVLVIAFFYTSEISTDALGVAAICLALIYLMRASGVRNFTVFLILGIIVWFSVLKSGIHATVAGVVLGFLMPVLPFYSRKMIPERMKKLVDSLSKQVEDSEKDDMASLTNVGQEQLQELYNYSKGAKSPLDRAIHTLHPWVSYFIMPVFALVNAGVPIFDSGMSGFVENPIAIGVILGLFVGKPLGIFIACYAAVKFNLASLPKLVTWRQVLAVGLLGGIGFTMALFVTNLALKGTEFENYAKLGILVASALAAIAGTTLLGLGKDVQSR